MTNNQLDLMLELTRAVIAHGQLPPEVSRVLDSMAEIEGKTILLKRQKAERSVKRRINDAVKQIQYKQQTKPKKLAAA